jgi:hypothetical protein
MNQLKGRRESALDRSDIRDIGRLIRPDNCQQGLGRAAVGVFGGTAQRPQRVVYRRGDSARHARHRV